MTNKERRNIVNDAKTRGYTGSYVDLFKEAALNPTGTPTPDNVAVTPQEQEAGLRPYHDAGDTNASMAFKDVPPNTPFNTVGMKRPIDIKKYDKQGHLVKSWNSVPPGIQNLDTGPNAGTIIETPARMQEGGPVKKQVGPRVPKQDTPVRSTESRNLDNDSTYNTKGWLAAGAPGGIDPGDGEFHGASVDPNTGMWLKSKNHSTAWKEHLGAQLSPDQFFKENMAVVNPEGYFGNNQLQYVPRKKQQVGGYNPGEYMNEMQPKVFPNQKRDAKWVKYTTDHDFAGRFPGETRSNRELGLEISNRNTVPLVPNPDLQSAIESKKVKAQYGSFVAGQKRDELNKKLAGMNAEDREAYMQTEEYDKEFRQTLGQSEAIQYVPLVEGITFGAALAPLAGPAFGRATTAINEAAGSLYTAAGDAVGALTNTIGSTRAGQAMAAGRDALASSRLGQAGQAIYNYAQAPGQYIANSRLGQAMGTAYNAPISALGGQSFKGAIKPFMTWYGLTQGDDVVRKLSEGDITGAASSASKMPGLGGAKNAVTQAINTAKTIGYLDDSATAAVNIASGEATVDDVLDLTKSTPGTSGIRFVGNTAKNVVGNDAEEDVSINVEPQLKEKEPRGRSERYDRMGNVVTEFEFQETSEGRRAPQRAQRSYDPMTLGGYKKRPVRYNNNRYKKYFNKSKP